MSFKHIRIEFSIDIDEHKRDTKYQQQKAKESLELAIKHIKENGLKRTMQFDDNGMIPLWMSVYTRPYAYCSSTYNSIKRFAGYIDTATKENRLIYKNAYEEQHSNKSL